MGPENVSPKNYPIVKVPERIQANGRLKIIGEHWEFENPPPGLDRIVDLHKFWTLIDPQTGRMAAQRISPALVEEEW